MQLEWIKKELKQRRYGFYKISRFIFIFIFIFFYLF
jgi:hypothetical protein